jgi:hypothetical protein
MVLTVQYPPPAAALSVKKWVELGQAYKKLYFENDVNCM